MHHSAALCSLNLHHRSLCTTARVFALKGFVNYFLHIKVTYIHIEGYISWILYSLSSFFTDSTMVMLNVFVIICNLIILFTYYIPNRLNNVHLFIFLPIFYIFIYLFIYLFLYLYLFIYSFIFTVVLPCDAGWRKWAATNQSISQLINQSHF